MPQNSLHNIFSFCPPLPTSNTRYHEKIQWYLNRICLLSNRYYGCDFHCIWNTFHSRDYILLRLDISTRRAFNSQWTQEINKEIGWRLRIYCTQGPILLGQSLICYMMILSRLSSVHQFPTNTINKQTIQPKISKLMREITPTMVGSGKKKHKK